MEITWLGHSCFRLRGRDVSIVIDPVDRGAGSNIGKVAADIVLVSHDHPGHNAVSQIGGSPRVLDGPGEYEIKGISIVGVQTAHDAQDGRVRGRNVVWITQIEDVTICHLGDIGAPLTSEQAEAFGNVDVLLVPVGGHNTVNAAQAAEIVTVLEPKVVVPMHYASESRRGETPLDPVDAFLREQGVTDLTPQPKLVVTKSNLPEEPRVVLLDDRRGA